MLQPIRILVVDDSAFARKVIRDVLSADRDFEVVGSASDGLEAVEKISELQPDVVTLDLVMPQLDGLGVLDAFSSRTDGSAPRFVVVSMSDADSELAVAALQRGAVELVHKPTALAVDRLYDLAQDLRSKVRAAAAARPRRLVVAAKPSASAHKAKLVDLVVIGTSTGGPPALTQLLSALPADLPVPVAVVVHMPRGFTHSLAQRLDAVCGLRVFEAKDGQEIPPACVAIAPAGLHLRIRPVGARIACELHHEPVTAVHRPSVDVLFASAAALRSRALGVVLTGMGDDGLAGSRALVAAGGRVLTEAASSCVVHGMPRCVLEAGLSSADVPLEQMAEAILQRL